MAVQRSGQTFPAEIATLRDGLRVVLRPIRPDDAPRLQALMTRLSPETIFLRTGIPMKTLSDRDARHLSTVDYERDMALAASQETEGSDNIVGVARYATTNEAGNEAEVAVVVEDAHQDQGLGTLLLSRLARYAREHGVRTFIATIAPGNDRVLRLITRTGLTTDRIDAGPGELEIRITLDNSQG